MDTHFYLHMNFSQLRKDVLSIPNYFEQFGEPLRSSADEIKAYTVDSFRLMVTAFGRMTFMGCVRYCYSRRSKAQVAYENALELMERNVMVPQPVGYIEQKSSLKLVKSFLITCLVDYRPVADVMKYLDSQKKNQLFQGFASFLYSLHAKGIFHGNLNMSNVLCKTVGGEFEFCLSDTINVRFQRSSERRVLKNMANMAMSLELFITVITEYALLTKQDPNTLFDRLLKLRNKAGRVHAY